MTVNPVEILAAAQGELIIIMRRGGSVAQLTPYAELRKSAHAWNCLLDTLEAGLSFGGEGFDRGALYDR